jgi:serine/threonine protein kinase
VATWTTSPDGRLARSERSRDRIGRYEILGELGRGGMGIVYLARDSMLGREVALKRLAGAWTDDPVALARFLREARAAAAVSSRFVVTIHAVEGEEDGPYLVLEYVRGISLQQRLNQEGALPVAEIVRVGLSIASGLAAAHERGVVHRDIKPGNILLADNGDVKITDFGLARAAGDDGLTSLEVLAGTPAYLAPEQITAQQVDHRADLFSLGSVLYAMCTGDVPFPGPTALGIVRQVAEANPPPIQERNPAIPNWLVRLVERLHVKDPAQRVQSAREVVQWLERGSRAGDITVSTTRTASQQRGTRRKRVTLAIGIVAGIVLLVLGAVLVGSRWPDGGESLATVRSGESALARRLVDTPSAGNESYVVVTHATGRAEQFSGLADALRAASAASTVTLHGAGPFAAGPLQLGDKALTLRAAPGSTPVISLAPMDKPPKPPAAPPAKPPVLPGRLLEAKGALTIEGLVLQAEAIRRQPAGDEPTLVWCAGPELRLRHCRLRLAAGGCCLRLEGVTTCELQNCELHAGRGTAIDWRRGPKPEGPREAGQLELHNCICSGRTALCLEIPPHTPLAVTLANNTMVALDGCQLIDLAPPAPAVASQRIRSTFHAERNVFDHEFLLTYRPTVGRRPQEGEDPARADVRRLPGLLAWSGRDNVYSAQQRAFLAIWPFRPNRPVVPPGAPLTVSEWSARWNGHEHRARMEDIGYAGGQELCRRAIENPHELTASAFSVIFSDPAVSALLSRGADTDQVGPRRP